MQINSVYWRAPAKKVFSIEGGGGGGGGGVEILFLWYWTCFT